MSANPAQKTSSVKLDCDFLNDAGNLAYYDCTKFLALHTVLREQSDKNVQFAHLMSEVRKASFIQACAPFGQSGPRQIADFRFLEKILCGKKIPLGFLDGSLSVQILKQLKQSGYLSDHSPSLLNNSYTVAVESIPIPDRFVRSMSMIDAPFQIEQIRAPKSFVKEKYVDKLKTILNLSISLNSRTTTLDYTDHVLQFDQNQKSLMNDYCNRIKISCVGMTSDRNSSFIATHYQFGRQKDYTAEEFALHLEGILDRIYASDSYIRSIMLSCRELLDHSDTQCYTKIFTAVPQDFENKSDIAKIPCNATSITTFSEDALRDNTIKEIFSKMTKQSHKMHYAAHLHKGKIVTPLKSKSR